MVVEYHRYLFYIENAPKVPDHEYDAMRSELEDFEKMYPHMKAEWSPIFKGASDDPEDYSPSLRHLVKVGVNIARRPAYEWCSL
jgi:NAD-dependent DNA ligase